MGSGLWRCGGYTFSLSQFHARDESLNSLNLIIKDKWLNNLKNALENKIQKRINALTSALNEIISSYSNSLLELDKEVKESESKVLEHLKDLGIVV
ncbi:hypothetical protein ckin116_08860 [Helicobacter pylori]